MKGLRSHFNGNGKAKVSYRTKVEALAFLTKHPGNPDHGAYQCPDCRQWHIGRGGQPR